MNNDAGHCQAGFYSTRLGGHPISQFTFISHAHGPGPETSPSRLWTKRTMLDFGRRQVVFEKLENVGEGAEGGKKQNIAKSKKQKPGRNVRFGASQLRGCCVK